MREQIKIIDKIRGKEEGEKRKKRQNKIRSSLTFAVENTVFREGTLWMLGLERMDVT